MSHMEFEFRELNFRYFFLFNIWCRYFPFAEVTKIKKEIQNYLPSKLPEIESRVTANRKIHIKDSILKGKSLVSLFITLILHFNVTSYEEYH